MDETPVDPLANRRAAYYAARPGGWRDWWTLLHPPYTAWHLAYVVIGACLAPVINTTRLVATLLAFFFAVGLAAHALDELHGRPLRTRIPSVTLVVVAGVGLAGSIALGVEGVAQVGWALVPFLVVGPVLAVAYNFELFGGVIHNDVGFAASWGAFPVLTAYVAQTGRLAVAPLIAAVGAAALSAAQRALEPSHLLTAEPSPSIEQCCWLRWSRRCERCLGPSYCSPLPSPSTGCARSLQCAEEYRPPRSRQHSHSPHCRAEGLARQASS